MDYAPKKTARITFKENIMFQYDFSNHQNRHIQIKDMPEEYYERIQTTTREDAFYPTWHIAPKCGLMNDPNGLCQIDGVHHIFYQWFPAGPVHGLKHWYHLKTRDFVHYEDAGVAMYPENIFDSYGCYTGMALREQGKTYLYYTGIQGKEQIPNTCFAEFDGEKILNRKKLFTTNPALTTLNYRDPYVWKKDDTYYMLVGGENPNHQGILLMYAGSMPDQFTYIGNVDIGDYPFGYMLECPNYYEENGRGILFFSPMGIKSKNKYDFKNVFSVVYAIGDPMDIKNKSFHYKNFYEIDKGFDFYAPQSYEDEKHRRILLGWLGNSKNAYPTDKNNWAHMMTMPRILAWEKDRLVQTPPPELKQLRSEGKKLCDWQEIKECSFEIVCNPKEEFEIEVGNNKGNNICFSANKEEYCLDRSHMTHIYAEQFGTVRYAMRLEKEQTIRIFADHSSLEIFCDSGKTVFTTRMFIENVSYIKTKGVDGTFYYLKQ